MHETEAVRSKGRSWPVRWLKRGALMVLAAAFTLLAVRAFDSQRGPDLELWHTFLPTELTRDELDESDWTEYLAAEAQIVESIRTQVTQRLEEPQRVFANRYYDGAPMHPPTLVRDWNRSYLEFPGKDANGPSDVPIVGAVVLLHGLTDSPYSLRHVGRHYREKGFVVVGIRLPGHGTVPAGLTDVEWEDWMAATRLAVRAARDVTPDEAALHIVGFSLGGALAMKYALDAVEDEALAKPDRLILISPMVGITRFARFAGLAGLPAVLPRFAKAAWLGILPEFNPFKYNSFPINGARQAHRTSVAIQRQILRLSREGRLGGLPPVLTFQSALDFTVSTPAVVSALYAHLPENGSELVLFDVNRSLKFGALLSPSAANSIERLVPPPPLHYRLTIIGNSPTPAGLMGAAVERTTAAQSADEAVRDIEWIYRPQFFSLSHVALPFPLDDALYGIDENPDEEFGIRLGSLNVRGERGALIVPLDALFRVASNPFFGYIIERIGETADDPSRWSPAPSASAPQPARRAPTPVTESYEDHWPEPAESP